MTCVYVVTNLVNGKQYVGQTSKSIGHRWSQHKAQAARGKGNHLHAAIRKYGESSFRIEPLVQFVDQKVANWAEDMMIRKHDCCSPIGYNICRGGIGFTSGHTEETRRKMSLTRKGKSNPWAVGNKNVAGKVRSPEYRHKLGEHARRNPELPRKGAIALWASLSDEQRKERCARMRSFRKRDQH